MATNQTDVLSQLQVRTKRGKDVEWNPGRKGGVKATARDAKGTDVEHGGKTPSAHNSVGKIMTEFNQSADNRP